VGRLIPPQALYRWQGGRVSPEEIEDRIAKISYGSKYHCVNSLDDELFVIIKSITTKQKNFVSFMYDRAYKEAVSNGVLTRFEIRKLLNERGLWTTDDEKSIKIAEERIADLIEKQNIDKSGNRGFKKSKKLLEAQESALVDMYNKKKSLFVNTAESFANEARSFALVYCLIYDLDDNKFWSSWDIFLKETDGVLISNLITVLSEDSVVSIASIREVARSPQWRYRWAIAKNHIGSLFDKPILDFDINQQNLLYWSQVYDSVYESHEPPSDDIIQNDKKLDAWFVAKDKKTKVKKIESGAKTGGIQISSEVSRHGEIFIIANKEIYADAPSIEDVESLNTDNVRIFKSLEYKRIKAKGEIREEKLRSRRDKTARRLIGSTDALIDKKNNKLKGGRSSHKQFPGGTL